MKKVVLILAFVLNILLVSNASNDSLFLSKYTPLVDWSNDQLPSSFYDLIEFDSTIYFANSKGFFEFNPKTRKTTSLTKEFIRIDKFIIHNRQLYAVSIFDGVFKYHKDKGLESLNYNLPKNKASTFDFINCQGSIYASVSDVGIFKLDEKKKSWSIVKGDTVKLAFSCNCIDSDLWIGTNDNKIYRLKQGESEIQYVTQLMKPEIRSSGEYSGIAGFGVSKIEEFDNHIFAHLPFQAVYRLNNKSQLWNRVGIPSVESFFNMEDYLIFYNRRGLIITDNIADTRELTFPYSLLFAKYLNGKLFIALKEKGLYSIEKEALGL